MTLLLDVASSTSGVINGCVRITLQLHELGLRSRKLIAGRLVVFETSQAFCSFIITIFHSLL